MELHEYQAKKILKKYRIPFPEFFVVSSVKQAQEIVEKHALSEAVVKVQIHAGGRGKAGGIRIAKGKEEVVQACKDLIGMKIVNRQTGPQGCIARKVMISSLVSFTKEYYIAITIDRRKGAISFIASPEGGMEIEEVASRSPHLLLVETIGIEKALRHFQLLRIAKFLKWPQEAYEQGFFIINQCLKLFFDSDAELFEINPLVWTDDKKLIALDTKMSVDDNAVFRHKEIKAFEDMRALSFPEAQARKQGLAYISLYGNIGCMVNGAGLAMATMDLIRHWGKEPANFLDVGGGATQEKVAEGLKILLKDKNVKAVLVNIFGGIMNCETIAQALCDVAKKVSIRIPIVVRMEGTNAEGAKKMLDASGLPLVTAHSLDEAASKIVAQVNTVCPS